jgi:hypothetical protein
VFAIKPPLQINGKAFTPDGVEGPTLVNVNVRGKRGNIVQTYPSVEYDFIPKEMTLREDDAIHFQWTGSDYNPARGCNDGTGGPPDGNPNNNARADRMNIVEMAATKDNMPMGTIDANYVKNSMFASQTQAETFAFAGQNLDNYQGCKTVETLNAINNDNRRENDPGNCAFMNRAGRVTSKSGRTYFTPYFNQEPVIMTNLGQHQFYSTRNNNFSNRDSKTSYQVIPKSTKSPTKRPTSLPSRRPTQSPVTQAPTMQLTPLSVPVANNPFQGKTDDQIQAASNAAIQATDADNSAAVGVLDPSENDAMSDGTIAACDRVKIVNLSAGSSISPARAALVCAALFGLLL